MLRIITAISIMLFLIMCNLQAGGDYVAYKMAEPPVLDGKADDDAWQKIPWAYGFKDLFEKHLYSNKQTAFKIGYDDKNLYIMIRCCEPEMAKVKTGACAYDGWPKMLDLVCFIYSNAYNEDGTWKDSPYTILEIGAGDIQRAHKSGKRAVKMPSGWKTSYRTDKLNWYIETAIPLRFMKINLKKGGWFNVIRFLETIEGTRRIRTSSWTTVSNAKLGRHTFSRLIFSPDSGVKDLAKAEHELIKGPANYGWWLNWRVFRKIKEKGGLYAEVKSRSSNSPNWFKVDQVQQKIKGVVERFPGNGEGLGAKTDAWLEWRYVLTQVKDTSAPIGLILSLHNADARVFINGNEIKPIDGRYNIHVADGANALVIEAREKGTTPGITIKVPSHPEMEKRWKVYSKMDAGCKSIDYDDSNWLEPTIENGLMWGPSGSLNACFRQVLLWNKDIYSGSLSCMAVPHTEYGFSPDTVEVLQHSIFKPTAQEIKTYTYQIELPSGFKLLDCKVGRPNPINWPPHDINTSTIKVNGQDYTRYTLNYNMKTWPDSYRGHSVDTCISLLPVKHENYFIPGGKTKFRFRRLVNGNITELTSALPVHILPPINGRRMKSILYMQYDHHAGLQISNQTLQELTRQGSAAGMDLWFVRSRFEEAAQIIRDNGARIVIWDRDLPMWGADVYYTPVMYELIKNNPEFAATYYNNSGNRIKGENPRMLDFCRTYALGEGRERFEAALRQDFKEAKERIPDAGFRYFNNENYPWGHYGNENKHRVCFCDRCKKAFKKYAGLPEAQVLSDQDIWKKYYHPWSKFWKMNQGELMDIARKVAESIGQKTIFYHNTEDEQTWQVMKKSSDLFFVGCPFKYMGRDMQRGVDEKVAFFQALGISSFIGQLSTYFPFRSNREGRYRNTCSQNGWALNPKQLKWEIVRMAATTQGGVCYESVMQLTGGSLYYFGEATRLIAAYEELFHSGKRNDKLADAGDYRYPDILVLTKGEERLVLIFNETKEEKRLVLNNHGLKTGQKAEIFEKAGVVDKPETMSITVPAEDVLAVYIK